MRRVVRNRIGRRIAVVARVLVVVPVHVVAVDRVIVEAPVAAGGAIVGDELRLVLRPARADVGARLGVPGHEDEDHGRRPGLARPRTDLAAAGAVLVDEGLHGAEIARHVMAPDGAPGPHDDVDRRVGRIIEVGAVAGEPRGPAPVVRGAEVAVFRGSDRVVVEVELVRIPRRRVVGDAERYSVAGLEAGQAEEAVGDVGAVRGVLVGHAQVLPRGGDPRRGDRAQDGLGGELVARDAGGEARDRAGRFRVQPPRSGKPAVGAGEDGGAAYTGKDREQDRGEQVPTRFRHRLHSLPRSSGGRPGHRKYSTVRDWRPAPPGRDTCP